MKHFLAFAFIGTLIPLTMSCGGNKETEENSEDSVVVAPAKSNEPDPEVDAAFDELIHGRKGGTLEDMSKYKEEREEKEKEKAEKEKEKAEKENKETDNRDKEKKDKEKVESAKPKVEQNSTDPVEPNVSKPESGKTPDAGLQPQIAAPKPTEQLKPQSETQKSSESSFFD